MFWSGFKIHFKEAKKGKRKHDPSKKEVKECPGNTEVEALSEDEVENHHREELPEKRVNIQTFVQAKQRKPVKFKSDSPVNEMEMVKGPNIVLSGILNHC